MPDREPFTFVGEPTPPKEIHMPSNPLTDVLPAKARKFFYAALFLAALVFSAYQASEGNWVEFAGGLIAALGGGTAASNTPTERAIP